jgi:hypothetical protein
LGQWTTIKRNAAELLRRELRPDRIIYCSPLSDPYQPAEATVRLMPDLLEAVAGNPPKVFVIQTRGPVIVRDIDLLRVLAARTDLRVSFSITADSDSVRRIFEPGCADPGTLENRCGVAIGRNRNICCDRSDIALRSRGADRTGGSGRFRANRCGPIVADPFHVRAVKRAGATTRDAANANGRKFGHGAAGFGLLACAGNIH